MKKAEKGGKEKKIIFNAMKNLDPSATLLLVGENELAVREERIRCFFVLFPPCGQAVVVNVLVHLLL